jgi:hypothetical protein
MRYIVAGIYAVVILVVTQSYFTRVGSPTAVYLVSFIFAYYAFNMAYATLTDWVAALVDPIDYASVHSRIIINMLAPFLAATLLARILYVVTGMYPLAASIIVAAPWLWMTNWAHNFLFPTSEEAVPRGLLDFFVPKQLKSQ